MCDDIVVDTVNNSLNGSRISDDGRQGDFLSLLDNGNDGSSKIH